MPALPDIKKVKEDIINSQVWRSMFRGGTWKDTSRDRAQHILGNVWLHLHPARVRQRAVRFTYTWGLGGLSFGLFMVLTVTGILLMFYYRPTVELAYRDMKDLEFAVSLGQFMRNMHRWSAHAMVMVVILHMIRVFLTGAYKTPREFNWGVGVVLLVLTLFLSFTGYLLPWDQLAIWAVTVGTNMASATHCVAVPFLTGVFMIVHFWRVRKDGFSAAPLPGDPPEKKWETWPHLVVREYIGAVLLLIFLTAWSVLQNAPLEELANPNVTPNPSKAPWYFLGLQELLVYFDPWLAGVALPGLIVVGLMAIPYIDPDAKSGLGFYSVKERPFANSVFLFGIALWFILIVIGQFMRGPNWAWYWPWEDWAIHKPPPPPTWDLILVDLDNKVSAFFSSPKVPGLRLTGIGGILAGLVAGAAVMGGYFAAGFALPRVVKRDLPLKKSIIVAAAASVAVGVLVKGLHLALFNIEFIGRNLPTFGVTQIAFIAFFLFVALVMGFVLPQHYLRSTQPQQSALQYGVTMALLLMMLAVVLKMGARLGFNIKYIFSLPSLNLNI
jgi:quinol-cytochrome oxidoreductase complex cytochrome b subunit